MDINRIKLENSSYIMNGNHAYGIGFGALCLYFLSTPSLIQKVLKYMSEVIISRRGGGSSGSSGGLEFVTEVITSNQNWIMRNYIKDMKISVMAIGGGDTGVADYFGGASGCVNKADLILNKGESVPIVIGEAGKIYYYSNGYSYGHIGPGTTTFGAYLSANGGLGAGGGGNGGNNFQFGGGGGYSRDSSGSTMYWGHGDSRGGSSVLYGGGGGSTSGDWARSYCGTDGGYGGIYGGGGGAAPKSNFQNSGKYMNTGNGGNGGQFGGGGGSWSVGYGRNVRNANYAKSGTGGIGGEFGGNGGRSYESTVLNQSYASTNGINTMNWDNIPANLRGNGACGKGVSYYSQSNNVWFRGNGSGGGGFGGPGGSIILLTNFNGLTANNVGLEMVGGAGGGGYGGPGGNTFITLNRSWVNSWEGSDEGWSNYISAHAYGYMGGGGGGYGNISRGGNGGLYAGGGGGGYFSPGDDAKNNYAGGGGGYYNYAHGGTPGKASYKSYGSGGNGNSKSLGPGVGGAVIIQYYV